MDSDGQDSDEGIVITEDNHHALQGQPPVEANIVYALLPKNVPVHRVARLRWWLDRINTVAALPEETQEPPADIQIISFIPSAQKAIITNKTEVIFLAQSYRFVYCLDMSPSLSTVDVNKGGILLSEVLERFKSSLGCICRRFIIPGSRTVFQPDIYVTVMVNTPFFMSPAQQVLVKGVRVDWKNLNKIIGLVESQFGVLDQKIAQVSALAHDQLEQQRAENDGIVGGLFDLHENEKRLPNIPMVVPDANFVNMLRYSMLAITLLPENSLSHILVISDGVVAMPDSKIMESLLLQLHFDGTALSFLKVGSPFSPNVSATYVPYMDLLYFLSQATLGTCIEDFTYVQGDNLNFNIYHELFLFWSFYGRARQTCVKATKAEKVWNPVNRPPALLSKKQSEGKINAPICLLLARRLREGYVIDSVNNINGYLEIKLSLLWKNYVYLNYKLTSQWPDTKIATHFEIHILAPYEFLHDITCRMKKELKSTYRQALIDRFWIRITQLANGDTDFAQHLTTVAHSNTWYTLPESVRSGIPVFLLNSTSHDALKLVLTPSDTSCPKFYNFWLPICQMETNSWRKWFHTSKFSLILKHDHPLPKHLHLANSSGRFQVVQSRQAASALYGMLANWAAFVLIDNHTYIKFLYLESDKLIWFCIIRVNCKFPCIVLNLGFLTGTPTHIRQKVCESIKEKLSTLSYQSSPPNPKETVCCTLLNKPLEKILIRYERMPSDFTTVIFPDGTQPPHTLQTLPKSPFAGTLFTTLSRYLYHRRWIWSATHSPHLRLDYSACSRILSTLTRMRLEEGFAIAYSSSGIITMVLELEMEPCGTCVVQYVLFPPHSAAKDEEDICSGSEEDVETDSELELQMVTEVWIEPQYGKAHTENQRLLYMKDRQYFDLADMLSQIDSRCIHSLLTLEHLSLMCQDKRVHRLNLNSRLGKYPKTVSPSPSEVSDATAPLNTQRIHLVPFRFDPLSILSLCRMTELLFSMFIESRHSANELFVENVLLQFDMIHDHELPLDGDESEQVTEHLMRRNCNESVIGKSNAKWRCFIKGISVTHVILTFVPASLTDLKVLTDYKKEFLRGSSAGSDCSEISSSNSPVLPVYLFDCQLSLLLDTYLSSNNDVTSKDVYLDYRFKFWNCDGKDTKNDDQEDTKSNSSQHFRSLTLTFSKCFMLSLFTALHRELYVHFCDVEAAVKQCEETIEEIDMTDFILGLCGHVKEQTEEIIHLEKQLGKSPCIDLKYMEAVIQKKWFSTIGVAFTPIPTKPEYYFCRDLLAESKLNEHEKESDDGLYYNTNIDSKKSVPLRYDTSGAESIRNVLSPLFLHFSYTLVYNNNIIGKKDFRFLPTCLVEILRDMKIEENSIERSKLKLTLNLTCLTLPNLIQNVSEELTGSKSQISVGIHSNNKTKAQQEFRKLHELQLVSISNLKKELIWLLKDEIITSLLDVQPVTTNSLHVITKHIAENTSRPSCIVDTIGLNFVYERADSFEKFVDEFERLSVPNYVICKQEDVYYLAKEKKERLESGCYFSPVVEENKAMVESEDEAPNKHSSESSEASSLMPSEGGYEEDISENEEEYDWIYTYEQKRPYLPNFWLIMQADKKSVTIYYHCRFMEFPAMTASYINMEKNVGEAISDLCKRVNQSLLLQSLDETRKCNALLEPDDNVNEWSMESMKRTPSLIRYLKGLDESNEEGECLQNESKFKPGYFSCPVVWETRFGLHPRLKVGPGKSGISRGILALKNILEKFSVSNRDNMFVYRDRNSNVFYLRLHENLQSCSTRSLKSGDLDHSVVSRSPSIASLPLGQKSNFLHSFEQASSPSAVVDVRPRVRSFGEKESNEPAVEDKLILKVHGITEAGEDVKYDLKDVLQNRLDDAVLEFLSIMLARNAMCPLTPEDVHFLQKPFKPPEMVIKISIQDFVLSKLDAFHLYLRQNLLQFLNIPKYTDTRPLFHFTDYSETDQVSKNKDDNIFIYNQSPSSGNKGIACIALAIVRGRDNASENFYKKCRDLFKDYAFQQTVMCNIIHQNEVLPETYLEFRLWTQGRVNIDSLSQKLKNATSQAIWDIITEYHLLKSPLCENFTYQHKQPTKLFTTPPDPPTIKEYDISDLLDLSLTNHNVDVSITKSKLRNDHIYSQKRPKKRVGLSVNFSENPETPQKERLQLSEWELGEAGILSKIYAKHLQEWLDFGCSIDAPTVKKHTVTLSSRHLTNVIVREILAIVQQLSRDSPKAFKRLVQEGDEGKVVYVPFMVSSRFPQRCLVVSRNFEQWKACSDFRGSLDYPELFHANHLKNMQKFSPCVVNGLFVPRQNVFMALVDNDQIVCYAYNWSKDSGDKLLEYLTNLGLWLSVRSGFLYSVVYQKLGMFHNQPLTRKHFLSVNSPFIGMIVDVEMLHKFPKDRSRRIGNMTPDVLETFRDHYHPFKYTSQDPIIVFAIQMLEVKHSEKRYREELKKLHTMYQTRTSNCSSNQINMLMQNSRIIHFCHTPLLFLPRWRLQAAATRDQSLMDSDNFIVSPAVSANENVEQWHRELCYVFLCEYRRYLQTMGFMPLQIDLVLSKKALKSSGFNSDVAYFNQKAILGGILVFTMQLREPFFITKLYAIECNRLQTCTSRASTNRFTLSFLDECDRIKILMHLHSFTYDFHLRCIHSYLSNNTSYYKICEEYHITHFLDDFMKYYSKAPNFAVNLIHADTITLRNLMTEGKQLYDYLLANINQYNFEVFVMTREDWKPNEYILVQVGNTQQISYKDAQNRQCTDDFNITVIVCNVCPPFTSYDNVLHLRYYLILTSKSEIYPKTDVEQKLGKFRTVSYTRSTSNCCELLEKSITEERNSNVPSSTDTEFETSTSIESSQTLSFDDKRRGERLQDNSTPEIQQESVNYLGYYSSHEQLMQQLILDYAKVTQDQIKEMVGKGMVHCRTHLLWNKLVAPQDCQSLTYAEFMELKGLARLHNLCDIRPNLGALLNQPLTWYQGLSKLLLTKYVDHNRIYVSADGNIQHYVILHPRYVGAFMLLSMDLHTSRGDLYAVYREPQKYEDSRVCVDDRKDLLEGFINCVCFYLWSGMI